MIVEKLKEIIASLCEVENDAEKCETGNAAAGRRLRKVAMEATKELKNLRAEVLEITRK